MTIRRLTVDGVEYVAVPDLAAALKSLGVTIVVPRRTDMIPPSNRPDNFERERDGQKERR